MKTIYALWFVLLATNVFGKAAFQGKESVIRSSEVIAILEVSAVEPAKTQRKGWIYSEVATAAVDKVLKGNIPDQVKLYGGENFICAQVRFKPGKFLAFLRYAEDLLTGANWHLSLLPINGKTVDWFENDKSVSLKPTALNKALADIADILANDWPIIVHFAEDSRELSPHLFFAYWQDGTVLLRSNKSNIMSVGRLEHSDFYKMWSALRTAGFFTEKRESYLVPDASSETIMIHHGSESATHSWHGVLQPGFGGDINSDPAYRQFVEMWQASEKAIHAASATRLVPVVNVAKEGSFRGYNIAEPIETPWLSSKQWAERASTVK